MDKVLGQEYEGKGRVSFLRDNCDAVEEIEERRCRMRTIKFRGRIVDTKEWVYGSLVVYPDGEYNILTSRNNHSPKMDDWCVETNTVGQFTGLHDKNGNEIYEGDIVNFDDTPYNSYAEPYTGKVMFYKGYWSIEIVRYGELVHPYLFRGDFADKKTTILGNIHDNPELLKGDQDGKTAE